MNQIRVWNLRYWSSPRMPADPCSGRIRRYWRALVFFNLDIRRLRCWLMPNNVLIATQPLEDAAGISINFDLPSLSCQGHDGTRILIHFSVRQCQPYPSRWRRYWQPVAGRRLKFSVEVGQGAGIDVEFINGLDGHIGLQFHVLAMSFSGNLICSRSRYAIPRFSLR